MPAPSVWAATLALFSLAVNGSGFEFPGEINGVTHPHLNFLDERSSTCSSDADDDKAMKLIRNIQGNQFFDYWDFVSLISMVLLELTRVQFTYDDRKQIHLLQRV